MTSHSAHQVRHLGQQTLAPGVLRAEVERITQHWRDVGIVGRLWQRDPAVWTDAGEDAWLGWLDAVRLGRDDLPAITAMAQDGAALSHVVVLGMGGSSLAPWVLSQTFGRQPGRPELRVLDSVDPAQIRSVASTLDLPRTLFVLASKSGTTAEPLALCAYFTEQLRAAGVPSPGRHVLAITDPGTALEARAADQGFRHVAFGRPDVGGRFSALTNFGLVPAALMGLDVGELLERADIMVQACGPSVPADTNPGVSLGLLLGAAAAAGRDKLTIAIAPPLQALGAWLEQLVAESTGKAGRGIVPIDGEPLGPPEAYEADRVFVHIRLAGAAEDPAVARLADAGHPAVSIVVPEVLDIGQEFFRWEVATAVASAVLGVNAFDQPDVEAAKVATRHFMRLAEEGDTPAADVPTVVVEGLRFHCLGAAAAAGATITAEAVIAGHVAQLRSGDYFAINAFLAMSGAHDAELQALRRLVHHHSRVATTVGYGPRFLHSTGQLHKGGPNTGVFLVLVSDDTEDLPVPGTTDTFGALKRAQALGDCQVLAERGRRLLRVDIGGETLTGLRRLRSLFEDALGSGDVR